MTDPTRPTKRCPDCAEEVLAEARVCRFCHFEFPTSPAAPSSPWSDWSKGPMPFDPPNAGSLRGRLGRLAAVAAVLLVVAFSVYAWQAHIGPFATGAVVGAAPSASPQLPSQPATHMVLGSITVIDTKPSALFPSITTKGTECHGSGGYSDLAAGASVILRDERGTVLSSAALVDGSGTKTSCTLSFLLPAVPDTAQFYVVTVSHRGEVSTSHADMVTSGWQIALTIGS